MRPRDVRAIFFWVISSLALLFIAYGLAHSVLIAVALTGAYNAWLLTRRRARRVFGRMRGEVDWSSYYQD